MTERRSTLISNSIEGLRREFIAIDNGHRELVQAEFLALRDTLEAMQEHLKTLNGRTLKSELKIAKLNWVVFGLGGVGVAFVLEWLKRHFGL